MGPWAHVGAPPAPVKAPPARPRARGPGPWAQMPISYPRQGVLGLYQLINIYIYCVALKEIPTEKIPAQAGTSHSRSKPRKHHKPHKPFRRAISLRSGLRTTSRPTTSHGLWRTSRRSKPKQNQEKVRKTIPHKPT